MGTDKAYEKSRPIVQAYKDEDENLVLTQSSKIHWSSLKCKRVTRSVLAAELYGMAHWFNFGAVIKATSGKILDLCQSYERRVVYQPIPLDLISYS